MLMYSFMSQIAFQFPIMLIKSATMYIQIVIIRKIPLVKIIFIINYPIVIQVRIGYNTQSAVVAYKTTCNNVINNKN